MNKMKEQQEPNWVLSYQDDDADSDIKLSSVETQLNIKTDVLETQGLDWLGLKPKVPLDSLFKKMLHQQRRIIKRDHKVSI